MINKYIQIGYACSHRQGRTTYRAVAMDGVRGTRGYNGRVTGIGDTRQEAEKEALAYMADNYRRLGMLPPRDVINRGRIPGRLLDAGKFWRDEQP